MSFSDQVGDISVRIEGPAYVMLHACNSHGDRYCRDYVVMVVTWS